MAKKLIPREELNTVEELLHSRRHNPILTLKMFKDVCRRLKKLEQKMVKQ